MVRRFLKQQTGDIKVQKMVEGIVQAKEEMDSKENKVLMEKVEYHYRSYKNY